MPVRQKKKKKIYTIRFVLSGVHSRHEWPLPLVKLNIPYIYYYYYYNEINTELFICVKNDSYDDVFKW